MTVKKQSVLSELHNVCEKLKFFEQKYKQSWETFDTNIASGEEDFSMWDDYMEWKAYIKTKEDISSKIDEVRHENFEISSQEDIEVLKLVRASRSDETITFAEYLKKIKLNIRR